MFMKIFLRLSCLLVAIALVLHSGNIKVQSASIGAIKDAAKTIVSKAGEAADKTEAVEEKGGIRANVLHTTANLVVDKTLDVVGARYPAVAAAVPYVKQFSKPVLNKIHSKINSMGQNKTVELTPTTTPAPALATKLEVEDGAKNDDKDDKKVEVKQDDVKEAKEDKSETVVANDVEKKDDIKEDAKVADVDDNDDKVKDNKAKKGKKNKKDKESATAASDDKVQKDDEKKEAKKDADVEVKKSE